MIQLAQVLIFDVAGDDALGLLGCVFEFGGTEERLHPAFNATYLLSRDVVLAAVLRWYG